MFHGFPPENYLLPAFYSINAEYIKKFSKFKEKTFLFQKAKLIFLKDGFNFKF